MHACLYLSLTMAYFARPTRAETMRACLYQATRPEMSSRTIPSGLRMPSMRVSLVRFCCRASELRMDCADTCPGALGLFLGALPTATALTMSQRTYNMYSTKLRDSFDFRDVGAVRSDGPNGTTGVRPYCNSHYTRHLLGLHALPLALSGQQYDAATGLLSFRPRRDHREAGARHTFAFFTPQGSGLVEELGAADEQAAGRDGCVRMRMLSGGLELRELKVDGVTLHFDAVVEGEAAELSAGSARVACRPGPASARSTAVSSGNGKMNG